MARRPLGILAAAILVTLGAIGLQLAIPTRCRFGHSTELQSAFFAPTTFHQGPITTRRLVGRRQSNLPLRAQEEATEYAGTDAEELNIWRDAYNLELDRSELLADQLKSELNKVGEASQELRDEFEGCILDLEPVPNRPESEVSNEWAAAYQALRRCNEQTELQISEMRAKVVERGAALAASVSSSVTLDFGPIQYQGITFKGIKLERFFVEKGSSFYFLELKMPLGLRLEETSVEPSPGAAVVRAIEVGEVMDGGSAAKDGRVRAGDFVRAISVPKRKLNQNPETEEPGGGFDGLSVALGAGAGSMTKALLVIPSESSFPFERVLDDMQKNRELDSNVAVVLERPYE